MFHTSGHHHFMDRLTFERKQPLTAMVLELDTALRIVLIHAALISARRMSPEGRTHCVEKVAHGAQCEHYFSPGDEQ